MFKNLRPSISIVVLNWNGGEITAECLNSLKAQSRQPDEVIVVDNGSSDGSNKLIKAKFPEVKLIELPKNLGFAGGVNVGIRAAKSDYVMLLNNDATCEPTCIEELLNTAKNHDADITQAVILTDDGNKIDSTGDEYSVWGLPYPGRRNYSSAKVPNADEPIFSASGGASVYKKSLFDEIGLFDEMFFAYYEDVDMSMRAQLRGKKVWLSSKATVQHKMNYSSNRVPGLGREMSIRNSIYLFWKVLPFPLILKVFPRFLYANWRITASAFVKGHPWRALRAQFTALIHSPHLLVRRISIQKMRKLSSKEFEALLSRDNPFEIMRRTGE